MNITTGSKLGIEQTKTDRAHMDPTVNNVILSLFYYFKLNIKNHILRLRIAT